MFWNLGEGLKKQIESAATTIQTQATVAAQQYMVVYRDDGSNGSGAEKGTVVDDKRQRKDEQSASTIQELQKVIMG